MSGSLVNAIFLQALTGLQLGAIYSALLALGLTLIFGTLGVVNFAHGALYIIAAYLAVLIAGKTSFVVAIVLVPLILFVVGIVLERWPWSAASSTTAGIPTRSWSPSASRLSSRRA